MGAAAGIADSGLAGWGAVGNVTIKSIKYSASYEQSSEVMRIKIPGSKVTESLLAWVNNEFTLEDIRCIDKETGKTVEFPHLQARFRVNQNFDFESIVDTETLLSSIEENYKRPLKQSKKSKIIESFSLKCREFWNNTRSIWIKNSQFLTKKNAKYAGIDCIELSLERNFDKKSLNSFLDKKHEPDNIGEASFRIVGKIIKEKLSQRPFICMIRKSSFAEIEKDEEIISEAKQEIALYLFCWEDHPRLSSEEQLRIEMSKMNELIKYVSEDFQKKEKHRGRSKIL